MQVDQAGLQQELVELAAMRLDPSSMDLFCGAFAIELAVTRSEVFVQHARVFHCLFEQSTTCLHTPAPVAQTASEFRGVFEVTLAASSVAAQSLEQSDPSSSALRAAEAWLTSALLDVLIWLEQRIDDFDGLVEAVMGSKAVWYGCITQACPWDVLPQPFDGLGRYHRMLLVVALNPDRLQSALAWYAQVRSNACQAYTVSLHCENGCSYRLLQS
jgi:hypothetical protein